MNKMIYNNNMLGGVMEIKLPMEKNFNLPYAIAVKNILMTPLSGVHAKNNICP